MIAEALRHRSGECFPIDSKRASGWQTVLVAHLHDQTSGLPHLPMQKPHGVLFVIVGPERI